jgi:hypothetical protein
MVCPRRFQARVQEGAGSWLQKAETITLAGPKWRLSLNRAAVGGWIVGGPHARGPLRVSHTALKFSPKRFLAFRIAPSFVR